MQQVVGLLRGLQVRDAELHTSHCFRRGAGVDVLETHGLRAMLEHGQWSTPRAAEPYASADEQTAQAMCAGAIEFSDDEGCTSFAPLARQTFTHLSSTSLATLGLPFGSVHPIPLQRQWKQNNREHE
jgi:hypothetical protein